MLLCFSRLRVNVVTIAHSHVTLGSSPRCLPAVTDCTAHSALSPASLMYSCRTRTVHNAAHLSSVHTEGRTLTFAAPDPGPCPDHPPSSLSPLSSSRPPQSSASRDLVTLYEQEPGLVTHCIIIGFILVTHNTPSKDKHKEGLSSTITEY